MNNEQQAIQLRTNLNWDIKHESGARQETIEQLLALGIYICACPQAHAGNTKSLKQIKALYSVGIFKTCKYLYRTYGPETMVWYAKSSWNVNL